MFVLLLLGTTSHPPGIAQGLSNFSNSLYSGAGDFLILPALRSLAQASFANVLLSGLTNQKHNAENKVSFFTFLFFNFYWRWDYEQMQVFFSADKELYE